MIHSPAARKMLLANHLGDVGSCRIHQERVSRLVNTGPRTFFTGRPISVFAQCIREVFERMQVWILQPHGVLGLGLLHCQIASSVSWLICTDRWPYFHHQAGADSGMLYDFVATLRGGLIQMRSDANKQDA